MTNPSTSLNQPNFNKHDVQVVRDAAIDARRIPEEKTRKVIFLDDYLGLVRSANALADVVEAEEVARPKLERLEVVEQALGKLLDVLEDIDFGDDAIDEAIQQGQAVVGDQQSQANTAGSQLQ